MTTEADIANTALARIGISDFIESLNQTNLPARVCKRFFASCRDRALRDFPWDFALAAEALALVSGQTFPGWTYVYQHPQDCLRIRAVGLESGIRTVYNTMFIAPYDASIELPRIAKYPWKIALKADGASKVVLSDVQSAWAFFTKRITNVDVFPEDFNDAFAWDLAAEAGGPLKADPSLVGAARQAYEIKRLRAAANAMNEGGDDREQDSPSIQARL